MPITIEDMEEIRALMHARYRSTMSLAENKAGCVVSIEPTNPLWVMNGMMHGLTPDKQQALVEHCAILGAIRNNAMRVCQEEFKKQVPSDPMLALIFSIVLASRRGECQELSTYGIALLAEWLDKKQGGTEEDPGEGVFAQQLIVQGPGEGHMFLLVGNQPFPEGMTEVKSFEQLTKLPPGFFALDPLLDIACATKDYVAKAKFYYDHHPGPYQMGAHLEVPLKAQKRQELLALGEFAEATARKIQGEVCSQFQGPSPGFPVPTVSATSTFAYSSGMRPPSPVVENPVGQQPTSTANNVEEEHENSVSEAATKSSAEVSKTRQAP